MRPVSVEDRTDLDACEEGEEGVDAEDPADVAPGLGLELVGADVGVEGADGVHGAQCHHEAAEGTKDAEPSAETAFRVGIPIGVRGDTACGGGDDVRRPHVKSRSGQGGRGAARTKVPSITHLPARFFQITTEVVAIWRCRDRAACRLTRATAQSLSIVTGLLVESGGWIGSIPSRLLLPRMSTALETGYPRSPGARSTTACISDDRGSSAMLVLPGEGGHGTHPTST